MDGFLLIDKPTGWTSFDVVAKVRAVLRTASGQKIKVGHAGTLDPLASGLLVLLIGNFTKRADTFLKLDKKYEVVMRLGQTSSTGDEEGEKIHASKKLPSQADLLEALRHFHGVISQVPPAYSAVKVDGKRAYTLARAGQAVKLSPRQVTIYELTLLDYTYPDVSLETTVSSGTYIRSLVEDIGRKLGTGAYTASLRRTQLGSYVVAEAITPQAIDAEIIYSHLQNKP